MEGGSARSALSPDAPAQAVAAREEIPCGDEAGIHTPDGAALLVAGALGSNRPEGDRSRALATKGETARKEAPGPSLENDHTDGMVEAAQSCEESETRSPWDLEKTGGSLPVDEGPDREANEDHYTHVLTKSLSSMQGDSSPRLSVASLFPSSSAPDSVPSSLFPSSSSCSFFQKRNARRSLSFAAPVFPSGDDEAASSDSRRIPSPPAFPDGDVDSSAAPAAPQADARRAGGRTPEGRRRLGSLPARDLLPRASAAPLFPGSWSCVEATSVSPSRASSQLLFSAFSPASPSPIVGDDCLSVSRREGDASEALLTSPGFASASPETAHSDRGAARGLAPAPTADAASPGGVETGAAKVSQEETQRTVFPSDFALSEVDLPSQLRGNSEDTGNGETRGLAREFPQQPGRMRWPSLALGAPRRRRAGSSVCPGDAGRDAEAEGASLSRWMFVLSEAEWRARMKGASCPLPPSFPPADAPASCAKRETRTRGESADRGDSGDTRERREAEDRGQTRANGGREASDSEGEPRADGEEPIERGEEDAPRMEKTSEGERSSSASAKPLPRDDPRDGEEATCEEALAATEEEASCLAEAPATSTCSAASTLEVCRSRSAPVPGKETAFEEEKRCPSCERRRRELPLVSGVPPSGFAAWPLFSTATLASSVQMIACPASISPGALPWKLHLSTAVFMFVLEGSGVLQVTEGETERDFPFETRAALSVPPLTPYRVLAASAQPLLLLVCHAPPPSEDADAPHGATDSQRATEAADERGS
uniref:Cupin domain-containing protein n=1 Tax=Toxoplasma gondii (strain ATCC 50861 / VEG) TaxID=432359 RepID=A0A0F7V1M2_TOXGV|nr:TPA: hypothetical protein BN1205_068685 [Toxoplasma gondii VEG]